MTKYTYIKLLLILLFFSLITHLIFGQPILFVENEVMVRFDSSAVIKTSVDNSDLVSGTPDLFLTPWAISQLNTKLDFFAPSTLPTITLKKVFTRLKTNDTISISRLGEEVKIPDFWATFILIIPDGESVLEICDSLNTFFPLVKYCHPNYLAELDSNDPLYPAQHSLHDAGLFSDAHINLEKAWEMETGKQFIRVGIFDQDLDWRHEDFGYDGLDPSSSRVVSGWDFESDMPLKSSLLSGGNHGTPSAGIIGAKRNNKIGIAGIAGGDSAQSGASLYGLIINWNVIPQTIALKDALEAIFTTSIESSSLEFGYGLHIMNLSWSIKTGSPLYAPEYIQSLSDAIHFANRNAVTVVASRGNIGTSDLVFPACFEDDWVLNVGGTGADGNYASLTSGSGFTASFGGNLDIAAPGDNPAIMTTISGGGYDDFGGTSAAAPHVSGVAALILSYLNNPSPSYSNLSPEDVEYLIQRSATDIVAGVSAIGYDEFTGHGRLNAGDALQLVQKDRRYLNHLGTRLFPNNKSILLEENNVPVYLTEPFSNDVGIDINRGDYIADVYQIKCVVNQNIIHTDSILGHWVRNSSSTPFGKYISDSLGNTIVPHEKIEIQSFNKDSANLVGYIYHLSDTMGTSLGWIPFDTSSLNNAIFEYSVLLENTLTGLEESRKLNIYPEVFPNPGKFFNTLEITLPQNGHLIIELFDFDGTKLRDVFNSEIGSGSYHFQTNINSLSNGVYFYRVYFDGEVYNKKFLKF